MFIYILLVRIRIFKMTMTTIGPPPVLTINSFQDVPKHGYRAAAEILKHSEKASAMNEVYTDGLVTFITGGETEAKERMNVNASRAD